MTSNAISGEKLALIKRYYIFGTLMLSVWGENAEQAIEAAADRLYEIDDKMSVFKGDSKSSKINDCTGKEYLTISKDTFWVN